MGRIDFVGPSGWKAGPVRPTANGEGSRTELLPTVGGGRRITVMENPLRDGIGLDEVADSLQNQIADGAGSSDIDDLERGVSFGGRDGFSYVEHPDAKSQVTWHVIVEHDMQVSIGCQYVSGEWNMISGDCEHVVASLAMQP